MSHESESKKFTRRRFLQVTGAVVGGLSGPLIMDLSSGAQAQTPGVEIIEISCERLPEVRVDTKPGEYFPAQYGERLKRFRRVIKYGTPHAQERALNQKTVDRLREPDGSPLPEDAIVYIPEDRFFKIVSKVDGVVEDRCVIPVDNPQEVTKPQKLDGPPGLT